MISLILATGARAVQPLLLLFSVFLLFRGHDAPGGGFSGGLVAAAAFILVSIAFDPDRARRALHFDPRTILAVGLVIALLSGLPGLVGSGSAWHGVWIGVPLFGEVVLEIGTPLIFDVGVYLTVLGATLTIVLALAEAPVVSNPVREAEQAASTRGKEWDA